VRNIEKFFGDVALSTLKFFVLEQKYPVENIDFDKIKNILVIIRHQMGDMLCASPMIRSLRKFFPEAHITLVTKSSTGFEQVFKHNSKELVDEVNSFEYGFENFVNLIKELRERKYDLAVVPSTVVFSESNHLISYYSRAEIRAGVSSFNSYDNKVDYLLNVKNDFLWQTPCIHQIERNLDVIRQIGIIPEVKHIKIGIAKENKDFADDFISKNFSEKGIIIGFHPGAAKEGNVWNPDKFAELAYLLHQKYDAGIFISEGPSDAKYVADMTKILKEKYGIEKITKHRGKLMNNMGIINRLNLFITNDTGLMHLASGLEIPVVALFGPTSAYEWGPLGYKKAAIQSPGQSINDIPVNRVYGVCNEMLRK
jgi:heptosyltransferase-2